MLRICDLGSQYRIETIARLDAHIPISRNGTGRRVDAIALHPEIMIEAGRLNDIQHSIRRFPFRQGSAFQQFSLSSYFKAIHVVRGGDVIAGNDEIHIPVRKFDDSALVLPSGRSLIAQVMRIADRIVVEDGDLSPQHLRRHLENFGLDDLRIKNVTGRTGMNGAWICIIDKRA